MKQSIDETCESFLSGETADDWDLPLCAATT